MPAENLLRVGKATAKKLQNLGLRTAEDLLFYFPFRYEDWSKILPISQLTYGSAGTCRGRVELIKNTRSFHKRKNITEALVSDKSGSIKVVWFNQPFLTKVLKVGDEIFLSGRVDFDRFGIHLTSPSYEKIRKGEEATHTARIVPVYRTTESLTTKQIRFLVKLVAPLAARVRDWMPPEIKKDFNLVNLSQALKQIHFPDSVSVLKEARHRLKFDELFLIQIHNLLLKANLQKSTAPAITFREAETKKFTGALPFKLTDGQRQAAWEILKDMASGKPMNRLLEGDVGSGKTVVAAIAALNVFSNGYRSVFMAPTEILARQHYETLRGLFNDFPIVVGLLTRTNVMVKDPKDLKDLNDREDIDDCKMSKSGFLKQANEGKIDLIIGTHALIQEKIKIENIGLAIVDEQHRFGVKQRQALKGDGEMPHFLSMTATPIPRTMSLVFFSDLDLSVIKEMPVGRKKILTKVVAPENRSKAYDFIAKEIKNGRQAFVICPLIDLSDKLGVKSAKEEYKRLSQEIFPALKIGLLHGKMKSEDKEKVMKDFLENKINILVSTSVVEVGVDVPNATIMMIEGAERFGLAQLHQFRGRVGRSIFQSYCFLFSESENEEAAKRLVVMTTCNDGFSLAEKDLEFRGPGEVWGVRQSGMPDLRIATLADYDIIKQAKEAAEQLIKKDPELSDLPYLLEKLDDFEKEVHLE
ncbi:ATP-dependent DNA helicase RecG [Candidatus Falkowbacteria bacterium]|nr:ATP-dependent DNA helicase RecG [Candidatus Falkowbacteria bacterium]